MVHPDSRRSYSWWSDNHVNVKNSKWLHENLIDMDAKVRAMIKIIEEDADSFARRAEMYYKRRPELMNLVEEFYKAYCALAARYDHTTGELRTAHRTIEDAFPDHIPFTLSDDSPWGSSVMDSGLNAPEIPNAEWSLFDLNNSQKDSSRVTPISPIVKKNRNFSEDSDNSTGKRWLKQLNETILSPTFFHKRTQAGGGVVNIKKLGYGRTRRGLAFEESEEKDMELKLNGPISHERNELKLQERETRHEAPCPQTKQIKNKNGSKLRGVSVSLENKDSGTTMDLEARRFSTAETQLHDLQMAVTKLQVEHDTAKICNQQDQSSCQRVTHLEDEISHAQEEIRSLNEDIFISLVKFKSAEEQAILFEKKCQYLRSNNESLERKLMIQQEEVKSAHDELEHLRLQLQAEHLKLISCEETLALTTQKRAQLQEKHKVLMLEYQNIMGLMGNLKQMNQILEEEAVKLKEGNTNLNAQNMSFSLSIKDLHDVLRCLTEAKRKLEEETVIHINKGNALQHEIDCMKQEKSNLEWIYDAMMEQVLVDMIEKECLHSFVRHLQDEDAVSKEHYIKKDEEQATTSQVENVQILESFNTKIKYKYLCLEKEKEALLNHLEVQDENILLKESCKKKDEANMIMTRNFKAVESMIEKNPTTTTTTTTTKPFPTLEKNTLLEKSLSEKNNDLEALRDELNILEDSFNSLMKGKSLLGQEKDNLATMVDNMIQTVNVLEALHVEFKEKGFCLEKEKEILLNHLKEVQAENILLKERCNKEDEEKLAMSQGMRVTKRVSKENQLQGKLLSDKRSDLEVVKENLSNLEDSISSLMMENYVLAKENKSVTNKAAELMQNVETSQELNTEVTEKCLQMEKETLLKQIEELQTCLYLERKQHISVVQSISDHLNSFEVPIKSLLLESEQLENQLEDEETSVLRAQIGDSVERRIVLDICRMFRDLSLECQKLHENSVHANEAVSQLKETSMEQQLQLESIMGKHPLKVEHHIKLRYEMDQLLELLKTDSDHVYTDKIGSEAIFYNLQRGVESMRTLLVCAENDNMRMFMECLISTTLLEQLGMDIYGLSKKKNALEMEAVALRQEIVILQSGKHDLQKMNELLEQKNLALLQRDLAWEMKIGSTRRQLYDLHESNRSLEHQNHKLQEESRSLAESLFTLNTEKHTLDEEMIVALLSSENVAFIFNSYYTELETEIKRFNADMGCISLENYNLKEQDRVMNDKLKMLQMENLRFRELVAKLEECEISKASLESEVDKFRSACKELKDKTELGQKLLNEKEHKLSDAKQKLEIMHTENAEIRIQLERAKKEALDIRTMKDVTEKDNMNLSIVNTSMSKKMGRMHREEEILKLKLDGLKRKFDDLKLLEANLKADLEDNKNENEMLDSSLANVYCDLIMSMVHSVVLEKKVYELKEQTQDHVKKFIGANSSMISEFKLNRENALKEQETEIKSEPVGHLFAISSLTDILVSPQDRCCPLMSSELHSLEDVLLNQLHYERAVDMQSKDKRGDKRGRRHELHTLHVKVNTMDMPVRSFENTRREYPGHNLHEDTLAKHQNILAEDTNLKCKRVKGVLEEKERLDLGSDGLLKEIDQCAFRNDYLKTELKASMEEIELWKRNAETFYHDLQSCAVREIVMKEKWKELVGICENLEIMPQHHIKKFLGNIASNSTEVDELKAKITVLKGLKEEVTCRSKAGLSIVLSIKESMRSIQRHCLATLGSQTSVIPIANDDFNDKLVNPKTDPKFALAGLETMLIELCGLQLKFKTVETLVTELRQFCESIKNRERTEKCYASFEHSRKNKIGYELYKTNSRGTRMDFVHDSSFVYRNRDRSYRKNGIEDADAEEQMLELWETAENHCNHGAEIHASGKYSRSDIYADHIFSIQKDDKDHKVLKLDEEREVVVDKMEVLSETRKNKFRNILSSEARRLMELQNTAQGLNKRIEKLRSNSDSNRFEIDNAKEQLHRTGSAILHLIESNHKLQRNSIDDSERQNNKLEEFKGKKIDPLEVRVPHMRKMSKRLEKLAHLESELQKIEFFLKRLEDENIRKRHADIDKHARDLLKEYLDGVRGVSDRKKQHRLCNCIRPSTKNGRKSQFSFSFLYFLPFVIDAFRKGEHQGTQCSYHLMS